MNDAPFLPHHSTKKDGSNNANRVIDKLAYHRNNDNIRQLAIIHIDELAETSAYSMESKNNNHQWLDENGWEFRTAYAKDKKGRVYEMLLNIGKSRDGRKILYDINNIKEIDSGNVASKGIQRNDQSLNKSKPQNKANVNKKKSFDENTNIRHSIDIDEDLMAILDEEYSDTEKEMGSIIEDGFKSLKNVTIDEKTMRKVERCTIFTPSFNHYILFFILFLSICSVHFFFSNYSITCTLTPTVFS